MSSDASGAYLRNAVMTATPEQLQLMLYDGAIRFASQARDALARGNYEESCEKLIRAQNIVLEMRNGLRHDVNESLCSQMAALYTFIYNRLVEANMKHDQNAIDEALKILHHQRETWQLLIDKVRTERAKSAPVVSTQSTDQAERQGLSLSIQG